ncbi:MAG TPA: hypothetical protein VKB86_10165, partial [Pyrinomonadaceae bacterium]|nr:hypothetical protein [Pyrinomonadaceae bacterium]
ILTTTVITGIPTGLGGDMAFSPTGTLYVIAGTDLYTISGTTATLVGNTGITNTPAGLAFGDNGALYASDTTAGNSKIYTLSTTTGAATLLGSSGAAISDMTAFPKFANLSITKSASGSFVAGTNATYTLSVSNAGPQSASAPITVKDTLPTGETFVSGTGTGWSCSASGQTVTCTNSSAMASGGSSSITLTVALASNIASSVTNTATVDSTTFDTNTTNNSSSVTTSITYPPDLTISKSHTGNFTQGQSGSYTITVTNSGTGPTTSTVTVTDTLPTGLTYSSATGTGWSCSASGQTVTCTDSNALAAGASYPAITLNVNVASNSPFSVTNNVSVSGGGEINTSNDSASDATTVNGVPDMTIAKSHSGNFTQGQTGATYTITATNSGTAATSGTVTVTDTLPASLTYSSATGTGWSCSASGQTVTCTRSDALAASSSYPNITVTVNVSATAPSSVTNSVSVSGGGETNTGNDSASDATTINQLADMTIAKSHTGNFTRGSTGVYTITATNSGTGATSGTITVTDTLPSGFSYSSATGTGWSCSASGQTVTCTRSDALAAGASYPAISLTVNVAQNAASSITNSVSVSGGGEVITSNDSASDATTIVSSADLSLTNVVTSSGSGIGTNATFTVTLTNSGPSDATNVAVKDLLPSGLTFVSSTPSTGTYNSTTGMWTVASLASGSSATLQLVGQINSLGSITTTAEVTASDQPDPDSTPNNHVATEDDQASASLSTSPPSITLCKTIQGQPCPPSSTPSLPPGSDISYVITFTNTGGSYASSFVITDPIPASTDFKVGSATTTLGTTGLTVTTTYSNNNGSSWTYTPASGGGGAPAGYDRNVTNVRWTFTGNLSQTSPNNTGSVNLTVRIR